MFPADAARLDRHGAPDAFPSGSCRLVMWLPLRRPDLHPLKDAGGITPGAPDPVALRRALVEAEEMAVVLAMLRHVRRITIGSGPDALVLDRGDATRMCDDNAAQQEPDSPFAAGSIRRAAGRRSAASASAAAARSTG